MLEVLLVEDCEADVVLVREAMSSLDLPLRLHHVNDGHDALAFLRREEIFAMCPRPDAVMLDANTPRRTGVEVLTEIRSDPALRDLRVVVFSSSSVPRDAAASLAAGADRYVTKPLEFDPFVRAVQDVLRAWVEAGPTRAQER
ncbi:response regulator [Deinococcus pimensis]|uniref:response regulator n=1 Tax=Deinococcus pimensis TaxID=309888 RepID=UPI0004AF9BAA|nr:response regulator [Deinococcus pimensis]